MFASDNLSIIKHVASFLPARMASAVEHCCDGCDIEEIRLRTARPMQIVTSSGELLPETAPLTEKEAKELLERFCCHSVYAHGDELRNGFITLSGGIRVGVCGRPTVENGRILNMVDVHCFNIRIPRQAIGCSDSVMRFILENGEPVSTLIAAPPGGGKTTLLRDIARNVSEGTFSKPLKTAIADERGELAACVKGSPAFDVGRRTDVFELAPKAEAISLLIRSMSPQVIITDEIGGEADSEAVSEAVRCGASVIASAHASSVEELRSRKTTGKLISERVFKRVLLLQRNGNSLRVSCAGA